MNKSPKYWVRSIKDCVGNIYGSIEHYNSSSSKKPSISKNFLWLPLEVVNEWEVLLVGHESLAQEKSNSDNQEENSMRHVKKFGKVLH